MGSDVKVMTADDFLLEQDDIKYETIPIPEWKTKDGSPAAVRIGSLSAEDMMAWTEANEKNPKQAKQAGLQLVVKSLVDMDGKRIGTDQTVQAIKRRSTAVLNRISKAVMRLNELNVKGDTLKNDSSGETPDVSPSGSQSSSVM